MKRNPRKTKWTKAFRKSHGKEMKIDATFEFEKKRNIPIKYDRNVYEKTVESMKRLTEIRQVRDKRFYSER